MARYDSPIEGSQGYVRETGAAEPRRKAKSPSFRTGFSQINHGAGKEARTLDLYLGKVSLYQLSYSRMVTTCAVIKKHIGACFSIWWPGAESNFFENPLFMRFFNLALSTFCIFFCSDEKQPRAINLRCPESQAQANCNMDKRGACPQHCPRQQIQ